MLHGWGGSKTNFESTSPAGRRRDGNDSTSSTTTTSTTPSTATRSSTTPPAAAAAPAAAESRRPTPGCDDGYIRLADSRYEARDTQYLLGLLADEGVTKPHAIGVTGISYGGGQCMELAFLKNRMPERQTRALDEPRRQEDGNHRRLPALAVVGPGRRADAERPLPRHRGRARRAEPRTVRRRRSRATSAASSLSGVAERLLLRRRPGLDALHRPEANITQDMACIDAGQPLSAEAKTRAERDLRATTAATRCASSRATRRRRRC